MGLDKQHPLPVYLQLKEMLRNQIERGVYFSHQKLPSERDLCQRYNLSRMTTRRALKALIAEGLAYTRAGKGTFVSRRTDIDAGEKTGTDADVPLPVDTSNEVSIAIRQQRLMKELLAFNSVGAERVIDEALAVYALETIALGVFPDIIRQCEQLWRTGAITMLAENYAASTLRSQLIAMVNAATVDETGPKVVVACAPGDQHDMGLLMLALSLRKRGCAVVNLGPNVTVPEFYQVIEAVQPKLVCFSAATNTAVEALAELSQDCHKTGQCAPFAENEPGDQKAVFSFGGVAFTLNPALVEYVPGVFLGENIETAVAKAEKLLL
jgi:DNA-binding transcriptional regulator YhcF (GntR family)